ncbi:hypothetical protein BPAE_0015g00680 [Botrytis paeoniae]|uniref:Uncharacterized protein n=1 Tax=Botrytis paeoniae TaxID=278948 RepID=A0A4Z1FX69_9HELO|nr:hypothetical protein BPAE_0015g00680 [Botrytis paeoniae]
MLECLRRNVDNAFQIDPDVDDLGTNGADNDGGVVTSGCHGGDEDILICVSEFSAVGAFAGEYIKGYETNCCDSSV